MIQHVVATVDRADTVRRRRRATTGGDVIARLRKRKLPDVGGGSTQRRAAGLDVGHGDAGGGGRLRCVVFVCDVAVQLIGCN